VPIVSITAEPAKTIAQRSKAVGGVRMSFPVNQSVHVVRRGALLNSIIELMRFFARERIASLLRICANPH